MSLVGPMDVGPTSEQEARALRPFIKPSVRHKLLPESGFNFIARTCATNRCGPCALSADVLNVLHRYSWPGNVRELENAIERAVVLAEGQPDISLTDLPPEVRGEAAPPITAPAAPTHSADRVLALEEVERQHILATLDRFDGHRRKTAEALDIGENTLWRCLKKWGLID